jgi:hypothetical protein
MSSRRRRALVCLVILAGVLAAVPAVAPQSETARAAAEEKKEKRLLASTGWATVKGRVTLKGDKPDIEALNKEMLKAIDANQDKNHCLSDKAPADQKEQQTWRIGKDNGVGNVFVWLEPPEGHYFKIDWDKKPWPKEVVIDQPHCAFLPHAVVHFPGAYDPDKPGELKPSGQKFVIKNSAAINHNTNWKGSEGVNDGNNKLIPARQQLTAELMPDPAPVMLRCDIHKFMSSVVRVFDHPYATVTDKDGRYQIKNAPAWAELRIVVWHEAAGYGNKGKEGDKVTLKEDKNNVHDYTIKAK